MPGVFVATVEFEDAAEVQSASLGLDPSYVLTEHPIQDRTDEEMVTIADEAIDETPEAPDAADLALSGIALCIAYRRPDPRRRGRHIEIADSEGAQRVDHRVHHHRHCADATGFADTFHP